MCVARYVVPFVVSGHSDVKVVYCVSLAEVVEFAVIEAPPLIVVPVGATTGVVALPVFEAVIDTPVPDAEMVLAVIGAE